MKFWINVETPTGTILGDGPIITASRWSHTLLLDASGVFNFTVPLNDPRISLLQPKRIVRCFVTTPSGIREFGSGIIDTLEPSVNESGVASLNVAGNDMLRDLTNRSVGFLELYGAGEGVNNAIATIMGYAPAGWGVDGSIGTQEPAYPIYGGFAGENILNALSIIAEKTGEHFRLAPGKKIAWLGNTFDNCGIRAVQAADPIAIQRNENISIIQTLKEVLNTFDICTRVYPYGSGVGDARLDMSSCTFGAPTGFVLDLANNCLYHPGAEAVYGRIDAYLSFKNTTMLRNEDIDAQTASNVLFFTALQYLLRHITPVRTYDLTLSKLDKIIYPGQKIRVIYRKSIDNYVALNINEELNIIEVQQEISEAGYISTSLRVSTSDFLPETDLSALVGKLEEGEIFEAHPQINANSTTISYSEPLDSEKSAVLNFWLGEETINIKKATLRFKVEPLRSTVKAIVNAQSTTAVQVEQSQTSEGGGFFSVLDVPWQYDDDPYAAWYTDTNVTTHAHGLAGHIDDGDRTTDDTIIAHRHRLPRHYHLVTVADHTHMVVIPLHTHNFTAVTTMLYGLFEETGINTLSESDLTYKINSDAPITGATSIGSGWYELDITSYLINGLASRPKQKSNKIVISTDTLLKTGTIKAQLTLVTTIQASAIL